MSLTRRKFLTNIRNIGLLAFGGIVWSTYLEKEKGSELLLRPPGALDEKEFLKNCIKCGMCVEVCPYDTLSLAKPSDQYPLGTPFFEPRDVPCYMCTDIPCAEACPTDALNISNLTKGKELDINKAKMGVAIVDEKNCVAFWGIQCDVCYRACPLLDEAIYLKYEQNERTGKHAFLKPVVDSDKCTGCGLCEHACITDKPAITILPRESVLGIAGSHYIKGWDEKDEARLNNAQSKITKTKLSNKSAIDSLNDFESLLDD